MEDKRAPTTAQIDYARDLIKKLGYDLDDYDFNTMTRAEIADLIRDLRAEWEGDME